MFHDWSVSGLTCPQPCPFLLVVVGSQCSAGPWALASASPSVPACEKHGSCRSVRAHRAVPSFESSFDYAVQYRQN